jgi:hypothetical protein
VSQALLKLTPHQNIRLVPVEPHVKSTAPRKHRAEMVRVQRQQKVDSGPVVFGEEFPPALAK